jgi:tRNA A-37 threonylcarbamoyl transferase component Bud32
MHKLKDTLRASVRLGFDGRVHKTFRGPRAAERFANEVRILRHLRDQNCPFVPTLLETAAEELTLVTTSCGSRVQTLSEEKRAAIFDELESGYGVRHDDPDMRNVTYRSSDGRFCVIDFEFAEILPGFGSDPGGLTQEPR